MSVAPLRVLIVDDEPLARQVLREEFADLTIAVVVGEAENGASALRQIAALRPDLVLLDVQMPGMDGFEVIRRLDGPVPPAIVFVTAYDEYALRAFDVGAVDYLLKPVASERLNAALARALRLQKTPRRTAERMERLLEAVPASAGAPRRIVGRHGKNYHLLDPDTVLAFQAEGEIVWIVTRDRRYMATQTLRKLEERLRDSAFRRIHRGVLVNFNEVSKMSQLSSQRWMITLSNGARFTVSKRQAHLVRDTLQG